MCPLSNILAETEMVLEVIPQQLHPILFHLISIMAMVHHYILVALIVLKEVPLPLIWDLKEIPVEPMSQMSQQKV